RTFDLTWQAHEAAGRGQVWEEDEFWIELSWRIDPDGALGIRKYFESPYRPGQKLRVEELYRWIFENSVPGRPERAARGSRRCFEPPSRPGKKPRVEELYRWIFENSVPGLPEAATRAGLTPL